MPYSSIEYYLLGIVIFVLCIARRSDHFSYSFTQLLFLSNVFTLNIAVRNEELRFRTNYKYFTFQLPTQNIKSRDLVICSVTQTSYCISRGCILIQFLKCLTNLSY